MKFSHLILFACLGVCTTFISCKDSAEESKTETPASVSPNANPDENSGIMEPTTSPGTMAVQPGGAAATGGATTGSQAHYTCQTAGCTGSGAAQGPCPVCGADLVHNQAYHSQGAGSTPGASPSTPVMIDPATGQPATPAQTTPPSAQNAAGEYHYACPAGHAGAASAGNCSTCGAALTHNTAYHNK
jgi:hypothetical protein